MKFHILPSWGVVNLIRMIRVSPPLENLALLEEDAIKKRITPRKGQTTGTMRIEVEVLFIEKDGVKEYAAGICKVSEEIHK